MYQTKKALLIITLLLPLMVQCGTKIGNPAIPTDEDGEKAQINPSVISFKIPELELHVSSFFEESSESDLWLDGLQKKNRNRKRQRSEYSGIRLNKIGKDLDLLIGFLSEIKIMQEGTYERLGDDKKISIVATRLVNDEIYDVSLDVQDEQYPFMMIKWNSAGNRIYLTRDFKRAPLARGGNKITLSNCKLSREKTARVLSSQVKENPGMDITCHQMMVLSIRNIV